jgi:dipeptidyl aminopeptidase/acylaminoacyl peptidase
MQIRTKAAAALLALVLTAGLRAARPADRNSLDHAIDSLFAVRELKEVAISPDGKRVAWVEALHEKNGAPSPNSSIYLSDLKSPRAPHRHITAGSGVAHAEHDIVWSPDGRRIAFLSDAGKKDQLELYVVDAAGGSPPRQLTRLTGFLAEPTWSPDGKTVAFLFTENAPRAAGPLQPMTPPSGQIEQQVYEQRLAVVDVATGKVREVSPPDLYVYEYDWSPDGAHFVSTGAHGPGDDNWWVAELYTIDANSGETKSILKPAMQMAVPKWSPDGRNIAFIGGLMSDAGANGGDVYVIPAGGGEALDVTPGMKASASWLTWLAPSNQILFTENVDGMSGVATVDPAGSKIATLWTGPQIITAGAYLTNLSLARDGKTSAAIRDSFESPPEVWAGPIGAWTQVTRINQDLRPSWGKVQSIHWPSDEFRVQGWLFYPREYNPNQRYPMVVLVHGGPASASRPGWPSAFLNTSVLSSAGYFVLYPNPRGSFGQGEAFTRANVKDFGYGDLRDILAGVDEVLKTLPVDNNRIGITGWSYGGFMTMWAVTQTHRFRAAVAGAGIANWLSYYGENDIDQWMIPYFGASVYEDPAVYAKSSPIDFIKNVKTPALVLVGDRDGECPAPQSFEFWHALKAERIPTQLVVYPNEGHDIWQPEHRRDIIKRMVAWFDRYLLDPVSTDKP